MLDRTLVGLTLLALAYCSGCDSGAGAPSDGGVGGATPMGAGGMLSGNGGTAGVGVRSCAAGVQTGNGCNSVVDAEACQRGAGTCACGSDGKWLCTSTGTGGGAAGGGASLDACAPSTPLTGGKTVSANWAEGDAGNGYTYTIWNTSGATPGTLTYYGVGAAFSASWNNSQDFLARVGLKLGSDKTYDKYGDFSADFAEKKTGTAGGYSYIGIYGWSVGSELHEYYIIDDWFGSRPSFAGTKVASFTIDGEGTYDILTNMMTGPDIRGGNSTFEQFWSLRTEARSCGHISITKHFDAWKAQGMVLGNMEEVKILVEAGGGTGSIDFTKATLTVD